MTVGAYDLLRWFDEAIDEATANHSPEAMIRWLRDGRAKAMRVIFDRQNEEDNPCDT